MAGLPTSTSRVPRGRARGVLWSIGTTSAGAAWAAPARAARANVRDRIGRRMGGSSVKASSEDSIGMVNKA